MAETKHRVCPWWLGYLLASPIRRLMQDPGAILDGFVHEGNVVLEPGPGMGFFTIELARRVGGTGRVIAVDIQAKMLDALRRRLTKAGLIARVDTRLVSPGSMALADVAGAVDFVLAFAMVHEFPDAGAFFAEAACALKAGGTLLLAEPAGHVTPERFDAELAAAAAAGLTAVARPTVRRSHAALLKKG